MTKYRIRLANGRVIGPFDKAQIFELKTKGHIKGNEEAQVYPLGSWGALSELDIYVELMDNDRTKAVPNQDEATFLIDLERIRREKNEKSIDRMELDPPTPVETLTETVKMDAPEFEITPKPAQTEVVHETSPELLALELDNDFLGDVEPLPGFEPLLPKEDKTVLNPVAQEELAAMRRREEEERKRTEAEEAQRKFEEEQVRKDAPEALVPVDESTQMFELDKFQGDLIEKATKQEKKLAKKELARKKALEDESTDEDAPEETTPQPNKNKKLILILASLGLMFAIFFPEDDKPKDLPFQHLPPQIIFPIPFDKADVQASKIELNNGIELLRKGTYPTLVKAGLKFKSSYENNLENKDALNYLVRSYAEELRYSKDKLRDGQILFNIIQSKRPFLIQDPNGTIGLNLFYMAIDKAAAAVDVTARYLKLFPKNVTQDLFAVYLESLIAVGRIDLAKQFFSALEKAPQKTRATYEAMVRYLLLNEETEKAIELTSDAIKNFPQHVPFYLTKAELLLKKKEIKPVEGLLQEASKRNLDYNDHNRAKFLAISGLLLAYKGQVQKATVLITKSLQIEDSTELRMKLADLTTTTTTSAEVDKLILDSKAHKLLVQAKDFYQKHNYELAMSYAARASDTSPGHIPSELFLSQMQLKLGFVQQSLATLNNLLQKYPESKEINITLIESLTEAYKFNEAKNRIAVISSTSIRNSFEYASVNAHLFNKMGDGIRAIGWYQASISANPLNDGDIYQLALIMIKKANFDQARTLLNKAMELDPINPDYRIAYARLIYETQDDQAAIGYLLGLLNEFGENPKFLGEIATFYYRAGKIKDFLAYKDKLEKLPVKDKALYEFLIKAALLDERYKEIPPLVENLLKIEPGEIEYMMTAGRVLFDEGKLVEAALWFKRVQERLRSYPKVQYYIAKIHLLNKDLDRALNDIQQDIKENGESDISLVLEGEILVQKGDMVQAETLFRKAQKINPNSFEALVGLADLSVKRSNLELALDLYKKAQVQRNDESFVHKKIGDVYRQLGQGSLAIESYKMYLEMEPDASDKSQIESYINLMQ